MGISLTRPANISPTWPSVFFQGLFCYGNDSGRATTLGQAPALISSVPISPCVQDMQGGSHPLVQNA